MVFCIQANPPKLLTARSQHRMGARDAHKHTTDSRPQRHCAAAVPEESDNQPIQCGLPSFTLPDEEKSDKINALMLNC